MFKKYLFHSLGGSQKFILAILLLVQQRIVWIRMLWYPPRKVKISLWQYLYIYIRVSHQNMFFWNKKNPTQSRGIWVVGWRIPKGFLISTTFRGCTRLSKIWPLQGSIYKMWLKRWGLFNFRDLTNSRPWLKQVWQGVWERLPMP